MKFYCQESIHQDLISRDDEKDLFYRYFGEQRDKKLVVAMGEYTNNMDGINAFINAAIKCPEAIFYYIGCEDTAFKFGMKLKRMIKQALPRMLDSIAQFQKIYTVVLY